MNIEKKTNRLVVSGVIAALYVALTVFQELIIPTSTSMAIQFRVSEALTVLSLFTPAAIPGLTVGCFIANFTAMGALPTDVIFGGAATFIACTLMRRLRHITFRGLPLASFLMPALINGIIIGCEIEIFFIEGPFSPLSFLIQAGCVAAGEVVVLMSLGTLLFKAINKKNSGNYLKSI